MKKFNLKNLIKGLTFFVFILTVVLAANSCSKEKAPISTTKTNTIGTAPQVSLKTLKAKKDTAKMPAMSALKDTAKM